MREPAVTSRRLCDAACIVLLPAALLLSACDEGRLVMDLELPADRRLDPTLDCRNGADDCAATDPRLARLSLRISRDGTLVRTQDTAITSAPELRVGEVPVDQSFDLRLAAQSVTSQILGLGVVREVTLSADADTRVAIKFRKPISYVAGGEALRVIDTVAPIAAVGELPAIELPGMIDVAAAPDGAMVAAITATTLLRFRTSDHFATHCREPPPACAHPVDISGAHGQPASCVAISPDSSKALVCHDTGITAVSDLAAEQPPVTFFQLGKTGRPSRLLFEPDGRTGWALVNAVQRSCGTEKSILVRLDLRSNQPTGKPIEIGEPAAGLALDPIGNAPLVTLPCSGRLGRLKGDRVEPVVEALPPVFDMAVVQQNVVLVGKTSRADDDGLEGQVISIDRSNPDRPAFPGKEQLASLSRRFPLPAISVQLKNDQSPTGHLLWVSSPRDATIYDIEVSPDGQRAVLLMQADYGSEIRLALCQYKTAITGVSYLLVDLDAGTVLLNRFTQLSFGECATNCAQYNGRDMAIPSVCADALTAVLAGRGELILPGFDARGTTLLFGY